MKRSEDESRPVNKFLDESESFKTLSELQKIFLEKFWNFEELLQIMLSVKHPDMATKITFKDFERIVSYCVGTNKYSAF